MGKPWRSMRSASHWAASELARCLMAWNKAPRYIGAETEQVCLSPPGDGKIVRAKSRQSENAHWHFPRSSAIPDLSESITAKAVSGCRQVIFLQVSLYASHARDATSSLVREFVAGELNVLIESSATDRHGPSSGEKAQSPRVVQQA